MRLLVVDDHDIVRKGLIVMLKEEKEFEYIQEASNAEEARKVLAIDTPDIALVDVNLNGQNGLDLIAEVSQKNLPTKFIVFTSSSRKGDYIRAKELNVDGYILKDSNVEDIIYAIKAVGRGRRFYDAEVTQDRQPTERSMLLESLTDREKEIFIEIGRGLSNAQIAEKLYITENTVKKHISSLLSKLGVSRRTEVALYATKLWRRKDDL
ncbi:response regulator transcription factor [Niameybacter massiliensis]|uniref:Stage 0 sporulation protein A homolog n=1 Tax=Holtiella tumoricola TaxID=3018743 RepID=A0AA42DQZ5_9FIRM|nr:response regulator transcription factor [Holtiella tumoricola]MDA3733152.1 response regulator transcription factor [Holtiella tumoricola]